MVSEYIDLKLDGYDFKLMKCEVWSVNIATQGSSSSNKMLLICALDMSSSIVAKRMTKTLELFDGYKNVSVFRIKDRKEFKAKIEQSSQSG
jgi:hypothetical protein